MSLCANTKEFAPIWLLPLFCSKASWRIFVKRSDEMYERFRKFVDYFWIMDAKAHGSWLHRPDTDSIGLSTTGSTIQLII